MSGLVVVGAGELARLALSFLREGGGPEPAACAVGAEHLDGAELGGLPVVSLDELERSHPPAGHDVLVCIGYRRVNRAREAVAGALAERGYALASLVHPAAYVSPDAALGEGAIVFPHAVVEPFAELSAGAVLWSGSVVAHDSRLGPHCFLAPSATVAGNVVLGARCFVGANATVRDGVSLGDGCVVGAGAVVKRDAPAETVFPAVATAPGPHSSSAYDTL